MSFRDRCLHSLALLYMALVVMPAMAEQTLWAHPTVTAPEIDGLGNDPAWAAVEPLTTHDAVADIDIELKAVHTEGQIFFLVRYPDTDESRLHRSWVWDPEMQGYVAGPDREDLFVFKWLIAGKCSSLSTSSDQSYDADIWFWKACRTDPAGHADDKTQHLNPTPSPKSQMIMSTSGKPMYLKRQGDHGSSSYTTAIPGDFAGDSLPRFRIKPPTGSRADVLARGRWADGWWTIEFARALDTHHGDDVVLRHGERHFFGVSRYEIAARPADEQADVPLYGAGDVNEPLYLEILK